MSPHSIPPHLKAALCVAENPPIALFFEESNTSILSHFSVRVEMSEIAEFPIVWGFLN